MPHDDAGPWHLLAHNGRARGPCQVAAEKNMTQDPSRPALDRYFTYRLNTLSKLNDMASQALYAAGTGLSLPEARALAAVGAFPGLTVLQLAMEVNLDKGQASRLAAAMVDKGLLERTSTDADRRVVKLALTRPGRQAWKKVMPMIEQRNRQLLACLSEDEQASLLEMFDRLLRHARQAQA